MSEPRAKGSPMSGVPALDRVHGALNGNLGDVNIQPRGLGHGDYKAGSNVGSFDSVKAELTLTGAGTFTVPHSLLRKPGWVRLWEVEHGSDPTAVVQVGSLDKKNWTTSTFQVRVTAVAGSLTGMVLHFEVGGSG